MSIILHMVANTVNFAPAAPVTETFTLTAGVDDIKTTTQVGYIRNAFGAISPDTKFLDIYGTNDHQVDELYSSITLQVIFKISGDSTVTNSGWTSIDVPKSTGGTETLNRSDATYTNIATTGGQWIWSSQSFSVSSGTVTITI